MCPRLRLVVCLLHMYVVVLRRKFKQLMGTYHPILLCAGPLNIHAQRYTRVRAYGVPGPNKIFCWAIPREQKRYLCAVLLPRIEGARVCGLWGELRSVHLILFAALLSRQQPVVVFHSSAECYGKTLYRNSFVTCPWRVSTAIVTDFDSCVVE